MHRWAERLAPAVVLLLCAVPVGVVTISRWTNGILFLGALAALAMLWWGRLPAATLAPAERRWTAAVALSLLAPLAAIVFAAVLRGDAWMPQFDAPSRLALAVPILLLAIRLRIDAASRMAWILPLTLAFTLAWHVVDGQPPHWPPGRMTTSFADPLVFGYLSLAFALMCLVSISPRQWREGPRWRVLLCGAGVLIGLYLSVRSGSRTGWMALPVVVAIWLHHHWGRGHPLASIGVLAAVLLAVAGAYLLLPTVQQRVDLTVREVLNYRWTGVAPHTSTALRITFARIASDLFMLHPWAGVGDTGHLPPTPEGSFPYATPHAVRIAYSANFHNQVLTNAVRAGVGGLLATLALLLVPLVLCVRRIRAGAASAQAFVGFAYFTTIFVASLSTEVVDLKYVASFHGVMTALLCGAVLARGSGGRPGLSAS